MEKFVIESLDLNAEIMALVRERLEAWRESHKAYDEDGEVYYLDGYDEVHCDKSNTIVIPFWYQTGRPLRVGEAFDVQSRIKIQDSRFKFQESSFKIQVSRLTRRGYLRCCRYVRPYG